MTVSAIHPGEYALMHTIPALDERCRKLERQLVVERDINRQLRERLAALVGDLEPEEGQ